MDEKLKNNENEAQIIRHEDLAKHNNRAVSYTHLRAHET